MKNENEINVLDELNKGACMGQDAISFILDKVENPKLKKVLDEQYLKYILNIVTKNPMKPVP